MRLVDQLRGARHTFAANRARVALTLLGIIIAAASIVVLASLLEAGQEALLTLDQDATEVDLMRVDRAAPRLKDAHKSQRELSQHDATILGDSPVVPARVTTERLRWTQAIHGRAKKRVMLDAAEPTALELYRLSIGQGRFFGDDDLRDARRVCVVGINVWRDLLDSAPSLDGVVVRIDGMDWPVIGVLANKPSQGGGEGPWMWNNKVLVPRSTFNAIFYQRGVVDHIYVRLDRTASGRAMSERVTTARGLIRSILLRHHLGIENFKIDQNASQMEQMKMIMLIINILLVSTGFLSLLVGGINIMNIMLVTVTERTREIGIRRAVGATPRSIILQFLLESALISLAGAVVGVVGGIALAYGLAEILKSVLGHWTFQIVPWSIGVGLALSMLTGVAFGLFPAWRASRLDPVTALRSV
jgi:putative ABC transport system permease protein